MDEGMKLSLFHMREQYECSQYFFFQSSFERIED